MVNVQKRLNGVSAEADFWYGNNLDHHVGKKAQNTGAPFMVKLDF